MSSGFMQWAGQPATRLEAAGAWAYGAPTPRADEGTLRPVIERVDQRQFDIRAHQRGGR